MAHQWKGLKISMEFRNDEEYHSTDSYELYIKWMSRKQLAELHGIIQEVIRDYVLKDRVNDLIDSKNKRTGN